jgi:hypothetical protein
MRRERTEIANSMGNSGGFQLDKIGERKRAI